METASATIITAHAVMWTRTATVSATTAAGIPGAVRTEPDTAESLWTRTGTVSVISMRPDGSEEEGRGPAAAAGEMAAEAGATDKGTSLCEASKR